jgi:glycine/D-amino acid oxidase-like deaminating enzyme
VSTSLWQDIQRPAKRSSVSESKSCDVVIVGAGFTGLWTAFWLLELNPSLDIVIVEKEYVGFGASGRNGGWFSALFPASLDKVAKVSSRSDAVKLYRAMMNNVTETGDVIRSKSLDCDWRHDGTYTFARSEAQLHRAKEEISYFRSWGFDADDIDLLPPESLAIPATNLRGSLFTPHCASVHPYKLVTELARYLESRGVRIYEESPATNIKPKRVEVLDHVVDAEYVVRATEAYTTQLEGEKRTLAPIYSFMIATEVLPKNTVSSLALNGSTFADLRNLVIYGQITKDNRIAFGGRGAPYHFGSKISASYEKNSEVSSRILAILQEMFPSIGNVEITHQWAGVLGIFRDWYPRVSFEKETGFAYAGGYIGDGVGSSALAGKTLAHLITETPTHLTELPWLNRPIRRWEIEPLRYLGISIGLNAMTFADHEEKITKRPSIIGKLMSPLIGH